MEEREAHSLAGIALFDGVDEKELKRLERLCQWHRYKARQKVFDRDTDRRDVFFVVDGAVRVVNYAMSGREIAFETVTAGEICGELAATDGLPRTASVDAIEDTLLAFMPAAAFRDLLRRNNDIALRVLDRLVRMVRACDERIMDLSTLGAVQRVYRELLRLAVPDAAVKSQWVIRQVPPEREIASRTSTARETVARALSQLRQGGIVRRKGRNLYILHRDRLEQITDMLDPGHRN